MHARTYPFLVQILTMSSFDQFPLDNDFAMFLNGLYVFTMATKYDTLEAPMHIGHFTQLHERQLDRCFNPR